MTQRHHFSERRWCSVDRQICSSSLLDHLATGEWCRVQGSTADIGPGRNLPKAVIEAIGLHANELYCVVPLFVEI